MSTYEGNGFLVHSFKGTTWANHKYIRKEGNRYIYPKRFGGYERVSSKNGNGAWFNKSTGRELISLYTNRNHQDLANRDDVGVRTYRFESDEEIKKRNEKQSSKLYKAKLKISAALGKIKNKFIKNFKSEKYDWDYSGKLKALTKDEIANRLLYQQHMKNVTDFIKVGGKVVGYNAPKEKKPAWQVTIDEAARRKNKRKK